MKTLLVGSMKKIEQFYKWLNAANEVFEVLLIVSEDTMESENFQCPVQPLSYISEIKREYDIIFVCSNFYQKLENILIQLGFGKEQIKTQNDICTYLSKADIMSYYAEIIYQTYEYEKTENVADVGVTYNVTFAASDADYNGTSVSISENGDLTKIAQAFAMQPSQLTSNMLSAKTEPQEGKIAFAAVKPDGSLDYNTTANGYGFWFDSLGNPIGWGSDNDSKVYVEYDAKNFSFSVGQYPGKLVSGDNYMVKEAWVYTKGGQQYVITLVFNIDIK